MFLPLYDGTPLRYIDWPYVNYGLIAVTVVSFFLTGGFDEYAVQNAAIGLGYVPTMANHVEPRPAGFALPEAATYLSYAFLHANWLHLFGNMAFLWVFGDNIEDAVGHVRYLLFYLVCAAASAFVHGSINPQSYTPLIGASGAVAGVVGAYLVLHPRAKLWILAFGRIPLRLPASIVLGAWALFQLYNVIVADPGATTAWWVHVGGLVVGALLVILLRRRGMPLFDRDIGDTR